MTQNVHDGTFLTSDVNYNAVLDLIFTDMNPRVSSIRHEKPFMVKRQGHHVLKFDYFYNINDISSGQNTLNNCKGDYVGLNKFFNEYSSKWEDLFLDKTIDEIMVIFYRIYNEGLKK